MCSVQEAKSREEVGDGGGKFNRNALVFVGVLLMLFHINSSLSSLKLDTLRTFPLLQQPTAPIPQIIIIYSTNFIGGQS